MNEKFYYQEKQMVRDIIFSIIIPHKNIPELLKRCLNSIPHREDVQIIVVDDNSDSDKVDFKRFPGLDDSFIEIVFTKEGKGAGYARNVGLAKATGKWILFADADDYFTDGFLQYLDKYINSNYDLIYFGIYEIDAETKKTKISLDRVYNKKLRKAIYNEEYDAYKYTVYGPVAKTIKKSLINENNIKFDETMVANDTMFSIKTAYYAKKIFFDENKIYTRELRRGSLVSLRNLESNFDRFYVYLRVNVFLESIAQKKYKINITLFLLRLIHVQNMEYFSKGMELIKENKVNLFLEIFGFGLSLPYRVIRKTKNIIIDKVGVLNVV